MNSLFIKIYNIYCTLFNAVIFNTVLGNDTMGFIFNNLQIPSL